MKSSHLYIKAELNVLRGSSQCQSRILPSSNKMFFFQRDFNLYSVGPEFVWVSFSNNDDCMGRVYGTKSVVQNNPQQSFSQMC